MEVATILIIIPITLTHITQIIITEIITITEIIIIISLIITDMTKGGGLALMEIIMETVIKQSYFMDKSILIQNSLTYFHEKEMIVYNILQT